MSRRTTNLERSETMSTWLITGCSTGLGRALAQAALARGDTVAATARDAASIQELVDAHPETALALPLDVTDRAQVTRAVRGAQERFGGIDVLVNNAGYGYRAAVEEADDSDVEALFETNFFGPIAMIKAVLPDMRARHHGTIVNISSIGARRSPPGSGYYAASKAALEALTASLRKEVEPLGIASMIVEPGAFRTDFSGRSLTQSRRAIDDYAATAGRRRKENDASDGTQQGDPAKAAQAIIAAVGSSDPPLMLVLGPDALMTFRESLNELSSDLNAWEHLSTGTSFDT
jgi:NAD(P)-dependent dehydrogenase (short-subunit alcohol dehydrogenase family)